MKLWIGVGAIALAMVGLFALGGGKADVNIEEKPRIGERMPLQTAKHLQSVDEEHEPYNSVPATSGAHLAQMPAGDYGIHEEELRDEEVVHGLEHGSVAFWYNANTVSDEDKQQLVDFFRGLPTFMNGQPKGYLIPRSDLEDNVKVAAVAWGYMLEQEEIDTGQLRTFYDGHLGKGPENAP